MEDLKQVENSIKETKATLDQVTGSVKALAEDFQKQVANSGKVNDETRAQADKLMTEFNEVKAEFQALNQKLVAGEQKHDTKAQTVGELVVNSEKFANVNSSIRSSWEIKVPRAAITSTAGSGADLVDPDRRGLIQPLNKRLTIRDLIAPGQTSSNAVEYVKETLFTNSAAVVPENTAKPYSDLKFENVTVNVKTIAHLMKASKQILDDAPALQSYINARADYGLKLVEESQFLYGSGTGNNLSGIIPQASAFALPSGVTVANMQALDKLRMAILQAVLADLPATGMVLNPVDLALIEMLKDGNSNYLVGRPQGETNTTLWKLPVVETTAITQNQFLVGAFSLGSQIFDREDVTILISTENADDFEKNMVTIRAEERTALAVYRPEAFVQGTFTEAAAS